MRALAIVSAAAVAALSGAAQAEEICLYGGPDAAADLACGQAFVAPARPAPVWSGAAESRVRSGAAVRANGAAESRILAGGRVAPAAPMLPSNYAPAGAAPGAYAPPPSYAYADPYAQAPYDYAAPAWPAPEQAYYYDPQAAPPPPPPALDSYVTVAGAGPAPGAYAYAYESADGGAFAWRYDTPNGPAWAYSYETPEGWAYAYAYETAPTGAPPPMIEAYAPAYAEPHRGPYGDESYYGGFHTDWRYTEETRLYGASYPRQLYLVETYYRDTGWQTVAVQDTGRSFIGCGACGGAYGHGGGYGIGPVPAPRPGFVVSGGGGAAPGFAASGAYLVGGAAGGGASASASRNFAASNTASMTAQTMATATGNQTVVAGSPFAPPAGAPAPPWGPPPQSMGPGNIASSSAFAGASAESSARR